MATQELSKHTDIKFTYEPIKKGCAGKITALKFTIEHNEDQLMLNEFIFVVKFKSSVIVTLTQTLKLYLEFYRI